MGGYGTWGINENGEMVYEGLVSTFAMGQGQMTLNFVDNVATFASFQTLARYDAIFIEYKF